MSDVSEVAKKCVAAWLDPMPDDARQQALDEVDDLVTHDWLEVPAENSQFGRSHYFASRR